MPAEYQFPRAPLEDVGGPSRPIHTPPVDQGVQTDPPPELVSQGSQTDPPPELVSQGSQTDFPPPVVPPRPIRYYPLPVGGGIGGRRPPGGGGPGGDGYNPEPNRPPWLFYLVGLSISYAIYQWCLEGFRKSIEEELTILEEEDRQRLLSEGGPEGEPEGKPEGGPEGEPEGGPEGEPPKVLDGRAVAVARWQGPSLNDLKQALRRGGLLAGGAIAGPNVFRRAFNNIALPALRGAYNNLGVVANNIALPVLRALPQAIGALPVVQQALRALAVGNRLRGVFGSLFNFGLGAFSSVSGLLCFLLGVDNIKKLVLLAGAVGAMPYPCLRGSERSGAGVFCNSSGGFRWCWFSGKKHKDCFMYFFQWGSIK